MEITSGISEKGYAIGCHRLHTTSDQPIMTQLYKLGGVKEEAASKIIKEYLEQGIIRPSNIAWRSPIIVVSKKSGGHRLCVDYRCINDITIKDAYSMPRVDEFIDALEGACYFTKLDAESVIIRSTWLHKTSRKLLLHVERVCLNLFNAIRIS